jgi:hypothetical protein
MLRCATAPTIPHMMLFLRRLPFGTDAGMLRLTQWNLIS